MNWFRSVVEKLKARRTGFTRLFILALVNIAVFAGITYRLAHKQELLTGEESALTSELARKHDEREELSRSWATASQNGSTVSAFWNDTVRERVPGLTEAWEEIDRLARESDVVKGRTGYDRDLLDVGLEQIKATMPVEGDYFDLVAFINRLERSERFFLVEEVQLSQRADESTIRLDCSISFYLKSGVAAEVGP